MFVSVDDSDVRVGKKALSGVKSVSKLSKKTKQEKKELKKKMKKKPALDDATLNLKRVKRQELKKSKSERWTQIITEVLSRSDLSEIHKEMLEKCTEPGAVPRRLKNKFINFILKSCKFEAKYAKAAEELFGILKTAEGSTPRLSQNQRKKEKRKQSALKWKLEQMEKKKKETPVGVNVENMEQDEDGDVDMETKTESEDDESGSDSDAPVTPQVKGRSKKNRTKIEKVGKKVHHLQGKLNKNKKGKGKDNKKRRSK